MGRGYSEACHSRIPEHAWHSAPYGVGMTRLAWHCCHVDFGVTHDGPPAWPTDGGPLRAERRPKAATPPTSRPKTEPSPRSRLATSLEGDAPLRRQDAVRLQQSPAGRRYCSHAYLDEAHVTKIEQQ